MVILGSRPSRPRHQPPHKPYGRQRALLPVSRGAAVLLVVALAGFAASAMGAPPDQWQLSAQGCQTTAAFFLVEYHQADRFLPPAFQPRDLAAFLYYTPVTSGKVPAFVALSTCEEMRFEGQDAREGTLQITYVGFFVEPPGLGSAYAAQPADYDFYTVAYLGPDQGPAAVPFAVTDAYGWRNEPAEVTLDVQAHASTDIPRLDPPAPDRAEALTSSGQVVQDGEPVFSFDAQAFFPQTFEAPPKLRFWHEGPGGLGWLEFALPMQTVATGPLGGCTIGQDSIVMDVIGHGGDANLCGPFDSFALVFARHDLTGRLHHLEGVHGAVAGLVPPAPLPPLGAAAMRVLVPLDVERAQWLDLGQGGTSEGLASGPESLCHDGASSSLPASGWERYSDPFFTSTDPMPYFRFRDDYQENGCGEARFRVAVPDGASTMTLSFQVDRQVESQARWATPRAFQTLHMYLADGTDGPLTPLGCFGEQEVFPSSWPSTRRAQGFTATFDFRRCDEAVQEQLRTSDVVIGFRFADGGEVQGERVPDGLPAGQLFRASVYAPQVTFDGIQLPLEAGRSDGLDPSRAVVGYATRTVDIPSPLPGQQHEVSFSISNQHGILGLYRRSEQGLERVDDDRIQAQEVEGRLVFTIGAGVVASQGAGSYEVLFTAPDTGRVSMLRLPLVGLALLLPLVAGAVAQRNVNHVHRVARQRMPRYLLQSVLLASWALYVAVALYLFLADAGIGMAAWPVPRPNLLAYVALACIAAGMVGIAVVARSIELATVRRNLGELEHAQRELERSNRELEQFAYVASHDLKEPLRMVAGYTQLLSMRYGDRLDPKGRSFLGFATEGASRLQRMVDDLLAYSRVRREPGALQPVHLEETMAAVRIHLKGLLEERGVDLRVGAMPTVLADRGQMVQLLLNLIQNAVKFSPQDRPVVEVGAQREGDHVEVWVRDHGIGIQPQQQERIFQIFQRLHLREEYEGNGIGLAVCRKIVEQYGGRIWVESAPGQGSTFHATLPAKAPTPPRLPAPERRRSPGNSPS